MAAFRTETGELSAFYWLARGLPHNATLGELFELANSVTRTAEQSANLVPLSKREREQIEKVTGRAPGQVLST